MKIHVMAILPSFQAPSEGCYNRYKHDCNRANGERMKRVEANYSAFKGGEHWFTISLKLDDWAINRADD